MRKKAEFGGTPGNAPVGYTNTRDRIDGKDIGIVVLDTERAEQPLGRSIPTLQASTRWAKSPTSSPSVDSRCPRPFVCRTARLRLRRCTRCCTTVTTSV